MLPKSKLQERVHRESKRHREMDITSFEVSNILEDNPEFKANNISILEFGSGEGFQIPYLKRLGKVIASDIYTNDNIKSLQDIEFVICDIAHTPFDDGQFDLIFSNHVIEHIADVSNAFRELQRIGKSSCIYAFSVPTNIWVLISLPAQYYNKFRRAIKTLYLKFNNAGEKNLEMKSHFTTTGDKPVGKLGKLIRFIMPSVHGVSPNFIECYRDFKIKRWEKLFSDHDFSIIKIKPLLLYGPSEWPIIPTLKSNTALCSSVLFLMKKTQII